MNTWLQFLSGKKTYLTITAIFVLLFGVWQAWWKVPNEVYVALMALALAFLRNGISSGPPPPPPAPAGDPPPLARTPDPLKIAPLMLFSICAWFRPILHAAALSAVILFAAGCASTQPGADPLVVNVERAETVGQSTFTLLLDVDNSNRPYWQTNAPAFHTFCQWLRQPQTIEGTNTQPRAIALLLSLDDVKLDYKAAQTSSNALTEALATFQGVLSQASAWSTLITSTNNSL
ncbi:MAG: hypothetical protein ACLP7I_12025 [Limisphaerales bacterium]